MLEKCSKIHDIFTFGELLIKIRDLNNLSKVFIALLLIAICCFRHELYIIDCTYCNWIIYVGGIILLTIFLCLKLFYNSKIRFFRSSTLVIVVFPLLFAWRENIEFIIIYVSSICLLFVFINNNISSKLIMGVILVLGIFSSLTALMQFILKEDVLAYSSHVYELSLLLSLSIVPCIRILLTNINRVIKYISIAQIILSIVIMWVIGSRTGILACLVIWLFVLRRLRSAMFTILLIFLLCVLISTSKIKINSTIGREFIYETSISLLDSPRKLICGLGASGFEMMYMQKQAEKLNSEPIDVRQLASNIKHPLNEFINIMIKFGLIGLIFCITCIIIILKNLNIFNRALFSVIIIFSCFTYPLYYPITWFICVYLVSRAVIKNTVLLSLDNYRKIAFALPICALVLCVIKLSTIMILGNLYWLKAYNYANLGLYDSAESYYIKADKYVDSPDFRYNYSYFEFLRQNPERGLRILNNCLSSDYDVTLLRANLFAMAYENNKAISEFILAEKMCPNRFKPLFGQYLIYEKAKSYEKADSIKNIILRKQIKVKSEEINNIIDYVSKK